MKNARVWFNVEISDGERAVIDQIVAARQSRSRSDLARTLFGEEADRLGIARPAGSFQSRGTAQRRRRITPITRAAIHMMADSGMSTSAIADELQLPRPTVATIRYGRDNLARRAS